MAQSVRQEVLFRHLLRIFAEGESLKTIQTKALQLFVSQASSITEKNTMVFQERKEKRFNEEFFLVYSNSWSDS